MSCDHLLTPFGLTGFYVPLRVTSSQGFHSSPSTQYGNKRILRVWRAHLRTEKNTLSFCLLPSKSQFIRLNEIFGRYTPFLLCFKLWDRECLHAHECRMSLLSAYTIVSSTDPTIITYRRQRILECNRELWILRAKIISPLFLPTVFINGQRYERYTLRYNRK